MRPTPKRGYHCDICHVCIEQYDHHCTWINNCVGKRNIGRFIFFLIFLILSLAFVGLVSVMGMICVFMDNLGNFSQWFMFRQEKSEQQYFKYIRIVLLGVNIIISLFVFPIFVLLVVQLKNLLLNKTTFERFTKQSIDTDPQSAKHQLKSKKLKNKGPSFKNCKIMCSKTR